MTKLVDYSFPLMMAENALKDIHKFMLDNQFKHAHGYALYSLSQIGEVIAAIKVMEERYNNRPSAKS
jgi:hypothetical protein